MDVNESLLEGQIPSVKDEAEVIKPLRMFPRGGASRNELGPAMLSLNKRIGNELHLRDLHNECGRPFVPSDPEPKPDIKPVEELPKPAPIEYPPLPQWNVKTVEERITEAEAFRGKLADWFIKKIIGDIRASARHFGEDVPVVGQSVYDQETCRDTKIIDIQKLVARHFNITRSELLSGTHINHIARPRQIAMYLSRLLTKCSSSEIGYYTGGRDHTTVLYAARKIAGLIETDKKMADEIAMLKEKLLA